jgi:hypothetical protein
VTFGDLADILEAAARRARELEAEARAHRRDWIDQSASALGRRRHCVSTRQRVAAGQEGAAIVGRRHLLSSAAHAEELALLSKKPKAASSPRVEGTAERLRRRLAVA